MIVVDTDILIDAGMDISQAVNCLKQYEQEAQLAVSIITKMELVVGCRDKKVARHLVMSYAKQKNSSNDLKSLLSMKVLPKKQMNYWWSIG